MGIRSIRGETPKAKTTFSLNVDVAEKIKNTAEKIGVNSSAVVNAAVKSVLGLTLTPIEKFIFSQVRQKKEGK